MIVNDRTAEEYFPLAQMVKTAFSPLSALGATFAVTVKVHGGGHKAQADAIRHGISRAMIAIEPTQRKDLKVRGFLKRDPRAKERKKFWLTPIIVTLVALGALIVFAQGSAVAPFIYTLF
jgi:small subunit ribosomal protein S9